MQFGEPVLSIDGSSTMITNYLNFWNFVTNNDRVKDRPNDLMTRIAEQKQIAKEEQIAEQKQMEQQEQIEKEKQIAAQQKIAKEKRIALQNELFSDKMKEEAEKYKLVPVKCTLGGVIKSVQKSQAPAKGSTIITSPQPIASKKAIAIEDIEFQFDAVPLKTIASKKARLKEIEKKLEEIKNEQEEIKNEQEDIKIKKECSKSELEYIKSALNAYNYAATIASEEKLEIDDIEIQFEIQNQFDSTSQLVKTSQCNDIRSRRENAAEIQYLLDKEKKLDIKENLDKQKISI